LDGDAYDLTFPRENGHGFTTYAAAASCSLLIGEQ
jgi:hypothetical protein